MARITLFFVNPGMPELERIIFQHPLLDRERASVRGKSAGAFRGCHTFQWTPAVQALCVLLLRSKAFGQPASAADYVPPLTGGAGSAAASLDYAISKQPLWLLDVFGLDKQGNCLIKRLVTRTNSERRRGGDVSVALNPAQLGPDDIVIRLHQSEVNDPAELLALARRIEGGNEERAEYRGGSAPCESAKSLLRASSTIVSVLPLSGAAGADADLVAGFSDEILTAFSRAGIVPVLARGAESDVSTACELLPQVVRRGCRFAVMGRLRVLNGRFQAYIYLLDADSGAVCWSGSYRGEAGMPFETQVRAAEDVLTAVSGAVYGSPRQQALAEEALAAISHQTVMEDEVSS